MRLNGERSNTLEVEVRVRDDLGCMWGDISLSIVTRLESLGDIVAPTVLHGFGIRMLNVRGRRMEAFDIKFFRRVPGVRPGKD